MLSGAPCPGALWAAVDALRTLMGLRLVPNAIITLVFELPLPLAAAVHVAVIALTAADNDAYCAMPVGGVQREGAAGAAPAWGALQRRQVLAAHHVKPATGGKCWGTAVRACMRHALTHPLPPLPRCSCWRTR